MPKNPDRPKIRYKPVPKKRPRTPAQPPSPEELRARSVARVEKIHKITPQKVASVILRERGLLLNVCKSLKIPRSTMRRYIDNVEVLSETLNYAREEMGDVAEGKLFELIQQGDVRCILYYLSTVHRHRGYGLNNADAPAANQSGGPVFVETVNIVGVPSGTFLPPEPKTIEGTTN